MTRFTKSIENNCRITREFLRSFITTRKSKQNGNQSEGKADLLTLFLENPDVFTDDDIIDELLDFLLAGTQTTSYATLTMLSHLAKCEESVTSIRAEFKKSSQESPGQTPENSATIESKIASLMTHATLESVQEQEYLTFVLNETLRHQSSVRQNTGVTCDHNMKIGSFNIRAKDQLIVNFHALHHNPLEWQRPDEFLPKRFDPKDPLFLTPKG